MNPRPRRVRIALALVCAVLAAALAGLWWRSGSTIDTLAWTTARVDPVLAAGEFPSRWFSLGQMKYDGAVRTFSIDSDDGQIRFNRELYLKRPDSSVTISG